MKTRILLLQMLFLYTVSFSQQNDCGNNAGFESGTVAGWISKHGYYGSAPCPPTGTCPRMGTTYTGFTQLNAGGINAPLSDAANVNRHVIVTGPGMDPNSNNTVPVVAPGGGIYSCRLGNGSVGTGPSGNSLAEAIRLTFNVNASNAGFTYRYACFVNNPGHAYESQPSFEVVVLDQNDNVIPCGRNFVVAGNYPGCVNNAGFVNGVNGYVFKNWTDVGVDLTGYIGQNISIEFRTTDCNPSGGSPSTTCNGNGSVCTLCINGNCCTYSPPQTTCTIPPGCYYAAGTHSAYAYIDAYCSPLQISTPPFICNGMTDVTVCAPAGFSSYSWPAGQPGITGSPTTPCVTINNPIAGTNYTVNVVSETGCTSTIVTTLQGVSVNSPAICQGDNATLTASGAGNYSWSTGETTASIIVSPSATTTYSVTAQSGSCTATSTATVTIGNVMQVFINSPSVCTGKSATLSTSNTGNYLWSTGETTSQITVTPTSTTSYSLTVTKGSCLGTASTFVNVWPLPPIPTFSVSPSTLTSSSSTGNQWYLNGNPINGATSPLYYPAQNGVYSVCVTNGNGCSSCSAPHGWSSLAFSTNITNVSCFGKNDGSASVTATSGVPPYTYSWSNGGTTSAITGLSTGTYTVTVSDSTSYALTATINISGPAAAISLVTSSTNGSCKSDGSASVTPSGGTPPYAYLWSTSATTQTIFGLAGGTYSITVTDNNGCTSTDTVVIYNSIPLNSIPVCLVTVDSTSTKNEIIWEKPVSVMPIDSFKIYRQISSQYKHIGSVSYSALSKFTDMTNGVNPNLTSYKYKIAVLDTCSNESVLSGFHQSIHLQISPSIPSGYNLFWNDYQGFSFNQYYILRDGNNTGNWQKIDSVSFGITTYTDPNPPTDSVRYIVEAPNPNGCIVSIKNPTPFSPNVNSARSNTTVNPNSSGIHEYKNELLVKIFPNPTRGIFNLQLIEIEKVELKIYTMYGECIHEQISKSVNERIDLSSQPSGIYFLKVNSEKGSAVKKIIINK